MSATKEPFAAFRCNWLINKLYGRVGSMTKMPSRMKKLDATGKIRHTSHFLKTQLLDGQYRGEVARRVKQ